MQEEFRNPCTWGIFSHLWHMRTMDKLCVDLETFCAKTCMFSVTFGKYPGQAFVKEEPTFLAHIRSLGLFHLPQGCLCAKKSDSAVAPLANLAGRRGIQEEKASCPCSPARPWVSAGSLGLASASCRPAEWKHGVSASSRECVAQRPNAGVSGLCFLP